MEKKIQPYDHIKSQARSIKEEYYKDIWSLTSLEEVQWNTKTMSDLTIMKYIIQTIKKNINTI